MKKGTVKVWNTGLLLLLISLIFFRLMETRSRDDSYFLRLTNVPIGKVIPVFALILLLSLIATANFRSIFGAQIANIFDFEEAPKRRITLLKMYLLFIPFLATGLYLLFKRTSSYLLPGVDGDYTLTLARNQVLLDQSPLFFNSNLLQGVAGNIYFPINFTIDPASQVLGHSSGANGIYFSHTLWSIILFSSIFYVTSALKFRPQITLFVSIFATYLFVLPGILNWTVIFFQVPWLYMIVAVSNFIIGRILHFQCSSNIFKEFLVNLVLIFYFATFAPLWIMVFLPIILIVMLLKLCSNRNQKTRLLVSIFLPWGVVFGAGAITYIAGLYLSSSSFIFSAEFIMPERGLKHTSVFFRSVPNATIVALGIGVGIAALRYKYVGKELSLLSSSTIAFYSFMTIFGTYFYANRDSYIGPPPLYTEFSSLPIIGILAGLFLIVFLHSSALYFFPKNVARNVFSSGGFLPAFILMVVVHTYSLPLSNRDWEFPAVNKIQSSLIDLSIYPQNAEFKGRVATFTGLNLAKSLSQPEQQSYDYALLRKFGDDFRHSSLWFNGIPTFSEYSPTISVWNYAYSKKYFFLSGDKSYRNILVKRQFDLDQLRLIGVSRIITDKEVLALGKPIVKLEKNGQSVFVYRLENSNLSGISFKRKKDLELLSEGISVPKTEAFDSKITRFGSGIRVQAKNNGKRYMLLPIEFSKCFDVESKKTVKIFRVNDFLTGIGFKDDLDVKITFRYGVLTNQICKIQDYFDFRKLQKELK